MNLSGKKVLITGGAGHIGSNLLRRLLKEGAQVRIADNLWRGSMTNLMDEEGRWIIDPERDFMNLDLTIYENCVKAVRGMDIVFQLADIVAGITYVFDHQPLVYRNNALINTNMIEAAYREGVEGFVYAGAACSYPREKQSRPDSPLLREEDAYPANPESAYGWSKLMGEYETELRSRGGGFRSAILRLHNVYGPYSDLSPERSQVIPSLIRKAIRYPDEPFIVWGDGSQTRAFVYVSDVVDALLLSLDRAMNRGVVQIGTERRHTVREIAETVVKISGKDVPIQYDLTKPVGDHGRAAEWTRAREVLGWAPKVSLEEGIALTYRWAEKMIRRNILPWQTARRPSAGVPP